MSFIECYDGIRRSLRLNGLSDSGVYAALLSDTGAGETAEPQSTDTITFDALRERLATPTILKMDVDGREGRCSRGCDPSSTVSST